MASPNTYSATTTKAAWATSATIAQVATTAAKPIEIIRVSLDQETSTTSAQFGVLLYRGGAVVTWTAPTTVTASKLNPSDGAAASTVTVFGTSVTDGASPVNLIQDGFNVLNGYLYLPVPEERIQIAASSWFCVKLIGTVPSATYDLNIVFREMG